MLVEHFPKMWLHFELLFLVALRLGKAMLQGPYFTHLTKMQAPPCVVTFDSGPLKGEGCTIKALPYIHVWNAKCTTNCLPSHDYTKKCAHDLQKVIHSPLLSALLQQVLRIAFLIVEPCITMFNYYFNFYL